MRFRADRRFVFISGELVHFHQDDDDDDDDDDVVAADVFRAIIGHLCVRLLHFDAWQTHRHLEELDV